MTFRFTSSKELPAALRGSVVAIGNFDGVHRGHQSVLETALGFARDHGCPALVLTFEPHPRQLFQPDRPLFRITPAPMKADILRELGFDGVIEMPFTKEFARLTADEFVDGVLLEDLAVRQVVTGFDFHFGRNRQGGPAFLMEAGETRGFHVTLVDAYRDANAEVVSSSRVREKLQQGDISGANGRLGYHYRVEAEVVRGRRVGLGAIEAVEERGDVDEFPAVFEEVLFEHLRAGQWAGRAGGRVMAHEGGAWLEAILCEDSSSFSMA